MTTACINHLWQSTVFAVAIGLLTLVFRRNHAQIRYLLWLGASCKFLVPLSLLTRLGASLPWVPGSDRGPSQDLSTVMVQITQPFSGTGLPIVPGDTGVDWMPMAVLGIWALGFMAVVLMRIRAWFRIRTALRRSTPVGTPTALGVWVCPGLSAPAVVGTLHPIVILPVGIMETLTSPQLDAVLAHERCHIRRQDNLLASIHMTVEALFWFHPFVWWIGARLIAERERACDQEVVRVTGEPKVYAEAIVAVCEHTLAPAHLWVSALTGAGLRRRIHEILAERVPEKLTRVKKFLLAAAGSTALIGSIAIGSFAGQTAHVESAGGRLRFKTATIRPTGSPGEVITYKWQRGVLVAKNVSVGFLVQDVSHNSCGIPRIVNAPKWMYSERFDIDADPAALERDMWAPGTSVAERNMAGKRMRSRVRALLEDRFRLKTHYQIAPSQVCLEDRGARGTVSPRKAGVVVIDQVQRPTLDQ